MLEGLDGIEWEQLTHAYGQADGIPARIRALRSSDPAVWVRAISDLYDTLCHQMCSIYPATVPAIPFLIELLGDRTVRCRGRILEFLADVTFVANYRADEDGDDSSFDEDDEGSDGDDDGFDGDCSQDELHIQTQQAIREGFDTYLELLSNLDQRIRVVAPYLLGALAGGDVPEGVSIATIFVRMQKQFEEEPNELVCASLVFGLACLIRHDSRIRQWLEQQVSGPRSSTPVRMAAALSLADAQASVSTPVLEVLVHGLQNPDETNQVFMSDQPAMENRHHPIGRAMLQYEGQLKEVDDDGRDEDMKFPWSERWQSGWVTFRILAALSRLKVENVDRLLPTLVPYLDQANECTGDSLVLPILKLVLGERKLSPETRAEEISNAERTVLLHLFNNVSMWATNMHRRMFDVTGLGNRRADWARLLRTDVGFAEDQIQEILQQKIKEQRYSGPDDVREIRLCRIGSAEFLPHLRAYANLKILDFADTSLSDGDLKQLAKFGQLRMLRLNNTLVTDAGIEHLLALLNLEELYLPGTKVTDACLGSLGSLPKIKYICLSNTTVSEVAAREFMEQHPVCRISR
jgi:hypothetical protein